MTPVAVAGNLAEGAELVTCTSIWSVLCGTGTIAPPRSEIADLNAAHGRRIPLKIIVVIRVTMGRPLSTRTRRWMPSQFTFC